MEAPSSLFFTKDPIYWWYGELMETLAVASWKWQEKGHLLIKLQSKRSGEDDSNIQASESAASHFSNSMPTKLTEAAAHLYQSSSRLMESLNFPYKIFFNSAICARIESLSSSSFSKFLLVTSFICSILLSTSSLGTWAKTSPSWNRTTSSSVRINSLLASSRLSFVS